MKGIIDHDVAIMALKKEVEVVEAEKTQLRRRSRASTWPVQILKIYREKWSP
jgi:hypothetical protein